MEDRPLQHPLKAERGLGVALLVAFGQQWRGALDELFEIAAQPLQIDAAGLQHIDRNVVVEQYQQQMLDGHELVSLVSGTLKGQIQRDFEIFT